MSQDGVSRRGFLSSVAAVGGAALISGAMRGEAQEPKSETPARANAVAEKVPIKARPFDLQDVRLLPGYWMDMMELNRSFLYSLPNERLAHNFRVTAGIPSDADPLGGWEAPDCELRGHYVGHYLSACALMHASTGDIAIRDKANALVATLAECQAKDGYLGAYPATFYDRLRNHQEVWAPFYTYHKIIAGLIDMYEHTGNQQALAMALRMADWADVYAHSFTDDDWQRVLLVEHGGMNEASFNLYAISGNTKYRDLGYRFEHKNIFDPLAAGEDKTDGHNAIATELGPSDEECCCSYNMMKLTRHLFGQQPDAKHFDYYERLLFNVRLGTQDRNGMLMYYVPLQP